MTRSAPIRKSPAERRRTRSGGVFAMSRGGGGHFNATRCIEVNYGAACGRNDDAACGRNDGRASGKPPSRRPVPAVRPSQIVANVEVLPLPSSSVANWELETGTGNIGKRQHSAALRESRRLGGGSVRRRQDGGFPNLLKGPTS